MKVKSESEVAQSSRLLATPWTAAHQAPPFMGFPRQEYWSGVPLPSLALLPRGSQIVGGNVSAEGCSKCLDGPAGVGRPPFHIWVGGWESGGGKNSEALSWK